LQVWLLAPVSAALIAAMLPYINAARDTLSGAIAKRPPTETLLLTYVHYFRLDVNWWLAVLFLATALFGAFLLRTRAQPRQDKEQEGFGLAEVTLAYAFVLYPAVLVAITIAFDMQYFPRYGWPALLGLVFMAAMAMEGSGNRRVSLIVAAALATSFSAQAAKDTADAFSGARAGNQASTYVTPGLKKMASEFPDHRIVIADMFAYLEMAYYQGHGLDQRMVLLTHTRRAGPSDGKGVAGGAVGQLARFTPLRLEDRDRFLKRSPEFLLYSNRQTFEWVPRFLIESGYQLRMLAEDGTRATIYLVSKPPAGGNPQLINNGSNQGSQD
jgi:hypothetical protein